MNTQQSITQVCPDSLAKSKRLLLAKAKESGLNIIPKALIIKLSSSVQLNKGTQSCLRSEEMVLGNF